jgi:hypothetical protein
MSTMGPLRSSVLEAKRRVRPRPADLILAVVVTVASAAAVGVASRAVRRVPLLGSASQMLQRGCAVFTRCIVHHLRTPDDCRLECGKHESRRGAAIGVALSSAGRHAHANACIHTLAQTDRAPVIVAGSLAVPRAV